jgi:hypothetical protein
MFRVSSVEEIKRATANLSAEQRMELYQWLEQSKDLRRFRYEQLHREIAAGIEEADRGETAPLDINAIKTVVRQRANSSNQR